MKRPLFKFLLCWLLFAPALSAQTNYARMLSGVNAQTGSTYTFVAADATRLVTFQNAGAVAVTLPIGTTQGFGAGVEFAAQNLGPGTATITCSSCLIFTATSAGSGTLVLGAGQGIELYANGTNYVGLSPISAGNSTGSVGSIQIANNGAFAAMPLICDANIQAGTDLGAKINACDTSLGASPGEIWAHSGGALTTGVVVSSTHILRMFAGVYTNSFGDRVPAIRLNDHSRLLCSSWDAIIQDSSNAADLDPVIVASFNAGPTINTLQNAATDISIDGCHFQGVSTNATALIGAITLGNCSKCSTTRSWFDGILSIQLLLGGTSNTSNVSDTYDASHNLFTGAVAVPLAVINAKNFHIHHDTFLAPGNGAKGLIDIEPNATTDWGQGEIDNETFDVTSAVTTTYCFTLQATNSFTNVGMLKIHDNSCLGPLLANNGSNFLTQGFILNGGNGELYNNVMRRPSQNGIGAINATQWWIHDNKIYCPSPQLAQPAINLQGNVTNTIVERNWLLNDTSCPFSGSAAVSFSNTIGESGAGNDFNVFRDNVNTGVLVLGTHSRVVSSIQSDSNGVTYNVPIGLASTIPGGTAITSLTPPVIACLQSNTSGGNVLNGTYKYIVQSLNQFGHSANSNEVTCTTAGGSTSGIYVTWGKVVGATAQTIYRTAAGGGAGTETLCVTQSTMDTMFMDLGGQACAGSPVNADTSAGSQSGSIQFANLPSSPNGTSYYCTDCKNVTDDTTGTFDSVAAGGGHGTWVLRENGAWRVH